MTEEEAAKRECPIFGLVGSLNTAAAATTTLMRRAFPDGWVHGSGGVATSFGDYEDRSWEPDNPCIGGKCMMWTGSDCGLKR